MFSVSQPRQLVIVLFLFALLVLVWLVFFWRPGPDAPSPAAPATSNQPTGETVSGGSDAGTALARPVESLRDTLADGTQGPELAIIPTGTFEMGSPDTETGRYSNERLHRVNIERAFAIGRYEISFDEYSLFAEASGREIPDDQLWGKGQHPVINVSWGDALAYTDWLSEQTGQRYRLPTEAEWEYAARAGTQTAYWWGSTFKPEWVNCYECDPNMTLSAPTPVGQFPANPFGLYDILGNVWEWTCSNYSENYDGSETECSSPADVANKAIRGGSYQNRAEVSPRFAADTDIFHPLRCAVRDKFFSDDRNDITGFRVVREL